MKESSKHVFTSADIEKAVLLLGLKDTTITLTKKAYESMSYNFKYMVKQRNLKIEVIDC